MNATERKEPDSKPQPLPLDETIRQYELQKAVREVVNRYALWFTVIAFFMGVPIWIIGWIGYDNLKSSVTSSVTD